MEIKNQIEQIIAEYPKNWSTMIKKRPELWSWVQTNKQATSDQAAVEIYSALHQKSNICSKGNTKRYINFEQGFGFCGLANVCECVKQQIIHQTKISKSQVTLEEQEATNKKRAQTNLEKYGVSNVGQTSFAKEKHQEFYQDPAKVAEATAKHIQTNMEKYGTSDYKLGKGKE